MISSIRKNISNFGIVLVLALVALNWPQSAKAALYKCTDANGETEYKDKPCKTGEQKFKFETKKQNTVGLHHSWFKKTPIGTTQLTCTELTCKCGDLELSIIKNPHQRLFDALHFFPENWKTYDAAYKDYRSRLLENGGDKSTLNKYACLIAYRKKYLREIYPEVSGEIINKHETLQAEYINKTCSSGSQSKASSSNETCIAMGPQEYRVLKRDMDTARRLYDKLITYVEVLKKPKPRLR